MRYLITKQPKSKGTEKILKGTRNHLELDNQKKGSSILSANFSSVTAEPGRQCDDMLKMLKEKYRLTKNSISAKNAL